MAEKIISIRLDDKGSFNSILVSSNNIQKSLKSLEDRQRRLNLELADVSEGSAEYNQLLSSINSTERAIAELTGELNLQSAGFGRLSDSIDSTDSSLESLIDQYNDLSLAGNTIDSTIKKQELLSASLKEVEGDAQAFDVLTDESKRFEVQLNKVNTLVNKSEVELEDYTRAADGFGKITSSSLTLVTLASQKLGKGSEEIEKYTNKLVKTIAITTAIKDTTEAFSAANIQSYKALIQSALGMRIFGASVKSLLGPAALVVGALTIIGTVLENQFGLITKLLSPIKALIDSFRDLGAIELNNLNQQAELLSKRLGLTQKYIQLQRELGTSTATLTSKLEGQLQLTRDIVKAREASTEILLRRFNENNNTTNNPLSFAGTAENAVNQLSNFLADPNKADKTVGGLDREGLVKLAEDLTAALNAQNDAELARVDAAKQLNLQKVNEIKSNLEVLDIERQLAGVAEESELTQIAANKVILDKLDSEKNELEVARLKLLDEGVILDTKKDQLALDLRIAQVNKENLDLEKQRQDRLINNYKARLAYEQELRDLELEGLNLDRQVNDLQADRLITDLNITNIQRQRRELNTINGEPVPYSYLGGFEKTNIDKVINEISLSFQRLDERLAEDFSKLEDRRDELEKILVGITDPTGRVIRKDPATGSDLSPERLKELTTELEQTNNKIKQNALDVGANEQNYSNSLQKIINGINNLTPAVQKYENSLEGFNDVLEIQRRSFGESSDPFFVLQRDLETLNQSFESENKTFKKKIEDLNFLREKLEKDIEIDPINQTLILQYENLKETITITENAQKKANTTFQKGQLDLKKTFADNVVAKSAEDTTKALEKLEEQYPKTGNVQDRFRNRLKFNEEAIKKYADEIERLQALLSGKNADGSELTDEQRKIIEAQIKQNKTFIKETGADTSAALEERKQMIIQTATTIAQNLAQVVGDLFTIALNNNQRQLDAVNGQIDSVQARIDEIQGQLDESFQNQQSLEDEIRNAREEDYIRLLEQIDGERARRKRLQEEKRAQYLEEQKLLKQRDALEKRSRELQKQQAITQATINGALAITGILAQPQLTPVGQAALIAGVTAITASQIAVIESQQFRKGGMIDDDKYAEGGFLRGASHGNGGIKMPELEGREFIVNKLSARPNMDVLNKINSSQYRNGTGATNTSPSQVSLLSASTEELLKAVATRPIYVSVKDIREGDARYADVVDNSLL